MQLSRVGRGFVPLGVGRRPPPGHGNLLFKKLSGVSLITPRRHRRGRAM